MATKDDLRRMALEVPGVEEVGEHGYAFNINGKGMIWPYPERVHPKKARVPRYDQYLFRVADLADKEALVTAEPDVFFATRHYNHYHAVILRLDSIDEDRLRELVQMAAEAAPGKQLSRKVPDTTPTID